MSDLADLAALVRAVEEQRLVRIYRDIVDCNTDGEWVVVERIFRGMVITSPPEPEGVKDETLQTGLPVPEL